jgi:broad specificity phosphatase PhoE
MKTTIYLVRHGEVFNPKQILYGRLPGFGLSRTGKIQAQKLGTYLSGRPIHTIYASPLARTRQTASFVRKHHPAVPFSVDRRLIEVKTPLEGASLSELEKGGWNFYQEKYFAQGGERLDDIWNRMNDFFSEIVPRHEGHEIVVVSHGDPIMLTAAKHSGKPIAVESIRGLQYIETAKGYRIEFEGVQVRSVERLSL